MLGWEEGGSVTGSCPMAGICSVADGMSGSDIRVL